MTPLWKKFCPLGFLILLVLSGFACRSQENDLHRRTRFLMGTLVEITAVDRDPERARQAIGRAFDEIGRLEKLLSPRLPESEVSRLNAAAGRDFIDVSSEVMAVVQRGIYWGKRSGGAMDITIGPVMDLWQFDEGRHIVPDAGALAGAVKRVGYRDIQIEGSRIRLARPHMALQLGAIAKGYAVDRAVAVLEKSGIQNALINAG
ncbi:MAG: FAD:protein FMN transferase, partial [Fidelibacterota bacterium]